MNKRRWTFFAALLLAGLGAWLVLYWYANKTERLETTPKELYEAGRKLGACPPQPQLSLNHSR
jgi:hypothetical protein